MSIVTMVLVDEGDSLPAISTYAMKSPWVFSERLASMIQPPPPSEVVVPIGPGPSRSLYKMHSAFASAIPEKLSPLVFFVMLSSSDIPVSSFAARSGVSGMLAVLSTVTARFAEGSEIFSAASVATAKMLCIPSEGSASTLQSPAESAVELFSGPSISLWMVTTVLASAPPPEKVKVPATATLVILSSSHTPVSVEASRSGVSGAEGSSVSSTIVSL